MSDNLGNIINRADAKIYPITSQMGVARTFMNESVVTEVAFLPANYKARWIKFVGCTFQGHVSFIGVDLGVGISFHKCKFLGGLSFNDVKSSGFDFEFDVSSRAIVFTECDFNVIVTFAGTSTSIERSVYFGACKLANGIIMDSIQITDGSLIIEKGTVIKSDFTLSSINVNGNVQISESTIDAQVRFENITCKSILSFQQSDCKKDVMIWSGNIGQGLTFEGGEYDALISIEAVILDGTLTMDGGTFYEIVKVNYVDNKRNLQSGPKKIFLMDCSFKNGIAIIGDPEYAESGQINVLEIKASPTLVGDISISNLHIDQIKLSGINSGSTIKFDDIHVDIFDIKNFYNHSTLVLNDIMSYHFDPDSDIVQDSDIDYSDKESRITISQSNLGKAYLYGVNFRSFRKIQIYNAILSEIVTSNVIWFNDENITVYWDDTTLPVYGFKDGDNLVGYGVIYKARQEIYRQLKYASDKQGDRVHALYFQRREMDNYRRYLESKNDKSWNDRIILWSSQSNDFGQDWVRPLWLLLLSVAILYIPIAFYAMPGIDFWHFDPSVNGLGRVFKGVFWDQLGLYPQLILPTHSLDRLAVPHQSLPGIIHFFDVFTKVVTSYFIFQTISAFRKYVKT